MNLLFWRKKEPSKPAPPEWWEENWFKVKARYPIGRAFKYLGRELIVTGRKEGLKDWEWGWITMPQLICEYADDNGNLHEWFFPVRMFPILLTPNHPTP